MKLIKSKYLLFVGFVALLATACSESDKVIDQITGDVTRGAVLRQVEVIANSVAIDASNNTLVDGEQFAVMLEYQDTEDGALLQDMNVYVGYVDNTDDGADNSVAESLFETVPASAFSTGDRGLPVLTYMISAQEMQSSVGLSNDQLGLGGDNFTVRFELILTDGRTFSVENNSGTITGNYFRSPFLNSINVVCSPSKPTAGTWIFETVDSYGDGWNGASLAVVIDGADAGSIVNSGATGTDPEVFELEVPTGSSTISIIFNGGDWDSEITYSITSANGNVVASGGPSPSIGVELLDYCADNL